MWVSEPFLTAVEAAIGCRNPFKQGGGYRYLASSLHTCQGGSQEEECARRGSGPQRERKGWGATETSCRSQLLGEPHPSEMSPNPRPKRNGFGRAFALRLLGILSRIAFLSASGRGRHISSLGHFLEKDRVNVGGNTCRDMITKRSIRNQKSEERGV